MFSENILLIIIGDAMMLGLKLFVSPKNTVQYLLTLYYSHYQGSLFFVVVEYNFALVLILLLSPYSEPGQPGRVSVLKMFLYIVIK